MKGQIKWFSESRGFGFIKAENGEDYFCHISEVICNPDLLRDGESRVTFEIGANAKGACAVKINILNP